MNLNGILIGSEDPEGWIATFADPDDNYFQLVSPFPG
jgi:predicted enzyme related to lactoylglutathione lyase